MAMEVEALEEMKLWRASLTLSYGNARAHIRGRRERREGEEHASTSINQAIQEGKSKQASHESSNSLKLSLSHSTPNCGMGLLLFILHKMVYIQLTLYNARPPMTCWGPKAYCLPSCTSSTQVVGLVTYSFFSLALHML